MRTHLALLTIHASLTSVAAAQFAIPEIEVLIAAAGSRAEAWNLDGTPQAIRTSGTNATLLRSRSFATETSAVSDRLLGVPDYTVASEAIGHVTYDVLASGNYGLTSSATANITMSSSWQLAQQPEFPNPFGYAAGGNTYVVNIVQFTTFSPQNVSWGFRRETIVEGEAFPMPVIGVRAELLLGDSAGSSWFVFDSSHSGNQQFILPAGTFTLRHQQWFDVNGQNFRNDHSLSARSSSSLNLEFMNIVPTPTTSLAFIAAGLFAARRCRVGSEFPKSTCTDQFSARSSTIFSTTTPPP